MCRGSMSFENTWADTWAGPETTAHGVTEAEIRGTGLQIKQHKAVPENRQEGFPPTGFRASVAIGQVDLNFQPVRIGTTVANHSLWAAPLL